MFGYASGPACDDLAEIDPNVAFIAFSGPPRSVELLPTFRRADVWWVRQADQTLVERLAGLDWIRRLYLMGPTLHDVAPLARLPSLETLVLLGALKLHSLTGIQRLTSLTALNLEDVRRVRSLDPLGGLTGLRALAVKGGIWTDMKVESLAPLGRLTALEELDLTSIRVADESLRPLGSLTALRRLSTRIQAIGGTRRTRRRASVAAVPRSC